MKKKITIIAIVLIIIVVANFIYSSIKLDDNNYTMILDNREISGLFNKHLKESISFKSALGNNNEQIYFYKSAHNSDIIVYKINGYKDVSLNDIHMYLIDNLKEIQINPQRFNDLGYFKLTTSLNALSAKKLILYSSVDSKIIKHFEDDTSAYISLYSNGLLITDNNKAPQIKFSFNEPKVFNLYFTKKDSSMFLYFLTSSGNMKLDSNRLLELIE